MTSAELLDQVPIAGDVGTGPRPGADRRRRRPWSSTRCRSPATSALVLDQVPIASDVGRRPRSGFDDADQANTGPPTTNCGVIRIKSPSRVIAYGASAKRCAYRTVVPSVST
jgi:hypothetical protein